LSFETEPYGIKILLVEPGVIKTDFVHDLVVPIDRYGVNKNGSKTNQSNGDDLNVSLSYYKDTIGKSLSFYFNAMSNAPPPKTVANEIIQAIKKVFFKATQRQL
jgi:short-subunit dehydrogenase